MDTPEPTAAVPQSPSPPSGQARQRKAPAETPDAPFPLVGIGCSAGGLEALEAFFSHVPLHSGMAFVVVQHLDPTHPSALPELLQHVTPMRVMYISDRMPVQPDRVYVIPPNRELSLLHDTLYLLDHIPPHGLRLPIDSFLRTLAADRGARAIGVILSGMGSDGVFGLKAIKEQEGLTLVQDPAEAQADSMPKSAIQAGVADIVATAAALPARIADYLAHATTTADSPPGARSGLGQIVILLRDRSGNDFSEYKSSTLYRRIERRTTLHHLAGIAEYVRFLRENPQELDLLFKELLIGVTRFFRDPAVWEFLRTDALPTLLAQHPAGRALRAWVPACSSGEEAYTLAIAFKEALERAKAPARFALQIYATDLDADAIDKARKGFYPADIAADLTPERLARWFVAEAGGYRIGKEIRDMVIFAPQNLISDPPFTRLDLLTCRNLLIYLGPPLQRRLLFLFHHALNQEGLLLLGSAETLGEATDLFTPLDAKARLYRRLDRPTAIHAILPVGAPAILPMAAPDPRPAPEEGLGYLTDQLIQQNYAPAAVLVNGDGDILYISGHTGKYLEPAAGKVSVNLHAMARPGLREALIGVLRNALRQEAPIHLKGVLIGAQVVDVTVQGITQPERLHGLALVVFRDLAKPRRRKGCGGAAGAQAQELEQTREVLRVAIEEMQTAVENHKSAQEELTISKEELQSLNEELQTVNTELQAKVDELTGMHNDMTNLLNSTEIATVFLDNEMRLRWFTPYATRLFKLIPGDLGRPLWDIVNDLDYPALEGDVQKVLRTLAFRESQASSRDGRWYRVRIMPYRTLEEHIDGVVITFVDISAIKKLEASLRDRLGAAESEIQADHSA